MFFPQYSVTNIFQVSSATSEQSFLTLRRLKNYLRSKMTEIRLNGLAILNTHKSIPTDALKMCTPSTGLTNMSLEGKF